jgi:predicted aspartyl protease
MHNSTVYRGFSKSYGRPVNKLTTVVNILPVLSADKNFRSIPVEIKALWDTGATLTFIKPKFRDQLQLHMARTESTAVIAGVGGMVKADFTFVSVILAQNFKIEYCPVYVLDFPVNVDMIIGMDIIKLGDFVICNTDNKTSFSFAIPPFPDRIDLADKVDEINKQNF